MSTPNEPQNPYGGQEPQEPQEPAAPQYGAPQEPQYGAPQAPPYGAPQAPQYGSPLYPAAPQYGEPGAAYPGAYVSNTAKNSLGVWSLVLGILSFVACGIFSGIAAIIVGNNAKKAVARGEANNGSLATAGVILGWIAVGLTVVGLLLVLVVSVFGNSGN